MEHSDDCSEERERESLLFAWKLKENHSSNSPVIILNAVAMIKISMSSRDVKIKKNRKLYNRRVFICTFYEKSFEYLTMYCSTSAKYPTKIINWSFFDYLGSSRVKIVVRKYSSNYTVSLIKYALYLYDPLNDYLNVAFTTAWKFHSFLQFVHFKIFRTISNFLLLRYAAKKL